MHSNRNVFRLVAVVTVGILVIAVAWLVKDNGLGTPEIVSGVSMESAVEADDVQQPVDANLAGGRDGAEAAAEMEAAVEAEESNPREFQIALNKVDLVHGTVTVPDGWHFGPGYSGVIIRNIPIDEMSYSGGVAVVRLAQPDDYSARSGVEPTDLLSTRSVNIGGSMVTQRMGTVPPEGAPPSGGDHGELTHAVVADSEGRELLQVVTFIQGQVSPEELSAIEAVFTDILASIEAYVAKDSG